MARDDSYPYDGEESPTPARNVRVVMFQRLVAILEELERHELSAPTDYLEIGALLADSTPELRAAALRACRGILRPE